MKKIIIALLSIGLLMGGCSTGNTESGKIDVVVSFYPLYDFATKIGGDYVNVTNIVPTNEEVHDFELTPQNKITIQDSQVFVYNGLELESWVDDLLPTLSSDTVVVDSSTNVTALHSEEHEEEEEEEEEAGHEHGEHDPHIWLDPENVKIQMQNIYDALVSVDPDHQEQYQENLTTWQAELDKLNNEFTTGLAATTSKNIVTNHEAFAYLANAYGLTQVPIEGIYADSEPDPQTLISIIEFMKTNNVKVVFVESLASTKISDTVAKETGASLDVLYTLEGITEEQQQNKDDYFSLMRLNLQALIKALS